MTRYVTAFFAVGLAAMVGLGLARGFDSTMLILLLFGLGVAVMGVAVARRFSAGAIEPAQCTQCGGVLAPSSPYCKHCGALR